MGCTYNNIELPLRVNYTNTVTMKKAYISRNYKSITSAGGKAKTDIESVISKAGFQNVAFRQTQYTKKHIDFPRNLFGIIKSTFTIPRNGILFLQYPMKKYFSFVCAIAHLKNTKTVTVIHDLGTFRRKKLNAAKEIKRLNGADYIIAQNETMLNWLKDHGYKKGLGVLGIFDYLSESTNTSHQKSSSPRYIVNYAGGLTRRKNAFLYEISPYINTFTFRLYGSGFTGTIENPNFIYKGFARSDDFISTMEGDFGLVWDGDSLDTCSGNFGIYLKYNTPHKISFYIRAHLPVIIWKEAAMAPFIEKEKVGFSIASLKELDDKLHNFSIDDYNEMKKNTIALSKKLQEGYFINKAAEKAVGYFSEQ